MRFLVKKTDISCLFLLSSCIFLLGTGTGSSGDTVPPLPPVIVGQDGAPMVLVPAGEFWMGSGEGAEETAPRHKVILDAYYMDQNEITNELFARFLNDYGKDTDEKGRNMILTNGPSTDKRLEKINGKWVPPPGCRKCPVLNVTWYGANQYARHYGKRLPTEAEWENACRAGTATRFHFGNDESKLRKYAWFVVNSGGKTHPVGKKKPNPWGIYDMYGNAAEWCYDRYDRDYYRHSPRDNPKGPSPESDPDRHVLRGGAWNTSSDHIGSGFRYGVSASREKNAGFRCAVDAMKDL